jgi:hypothetical protein
VAVELNYKAFRRSLRNFSQSFGSALVGFLQAGAGARARNSQDKMRDFVCILDFIPVAEHAAIAARTSTYDCYADIMEAINSVTYTLTSEYVAGPAIYFPPGKYKCNSTLDLKKSVRLFGDASGLPYSPYSMLSFPAAVHGIVVNRNNTTSGGIDSPATSAADATIIDGLVIEGVNSGAVAHGVWLRARALIRNCNILRFSGNGINVVATAGSGGATTEGNANNFRIEGGRVELCGKSGLFVDGADANAGYVIGLDCSDNGEWGIWDSSFLGNTYLACHTAGNVLGPYKSDNANARNLFLNCYSESGQPASSLLHPAMVVLGSHGAGFTSTSTNQYIGEGRASNFTNTNTSGAVTVTGHFAVDASNGQVFGFGVGDTSSTDIYRIQWDATSKLWHFMHRNLGTRKAISFTAEDHSLGAGHSVFTPGYYLFDGTTYYRRVLGSAAPVSGTWTRGSVVENTAPSEAGGAGSKYVITGWICTVAGTPGTWLETRALTGN